LKRFSTENPLIVAMTMAVFILSILSMLWPYAEEMPMSRDGSLTIVSPLKFGGRCFTSITWMLSWSTNARLNLECFLNVVTYKAPTILSNFFVLGCTKGCSKYRDANS
jgi:hypothetical protein